MVFKLVSPQPAGFPRHKRKIVTRRGNIPFWVHIAKNPLIDPIGVRSLALLQVTPEAIAVLPESVKRAFLEFQRALEKKSHQTAIATAKAACLEILDDKSSIGRSIAVYYYGVIPVFELDETIEIVDGAGRASRCTLALVPDFPSFAKSRFAPAEPKRGTQIVLFRKRGDDSDDLVILKGYAIELFKVVESYLEEAGNLCRILLDRSSGHLLFEKAAAIKEIIAERIGLKLKHFRLCVGSDHLDAEEIIVARELAKKNIEGLLLAEMGSFIFHRAIASYLKLYDIGFDVVNGNSVSYLGFPNNLASRWQISEHNFSSIIESNALLSLLYDACLHPTELLKHSDEDFDHYFWLHDLSEIIERTEFLRREGISLASANLFLSQRTGSELGESLLRSIDLERIPGTHLRVYHRTGPTPNEFPKEIGWYIWACSSFLSHLSGSELNEGEGLSWLTKELDIAVLQRKRSLGIAREKQVDMKLIAHHLQSSEDIFESLPESERALRIKSILAHLDPSRHLHFVYDSNKEESMGGQVLAIRAWMKSIQLDSAEAYFGGLFALFGYRTQRALAYMCSKHFGREVYFSRELKEWLGTKSSLVDVRECVSKFPIILNGIHHSIVDYSQSHPNSNSGYIYKNRFPDLVRHLFPSVDIESLRRRLFNEQHELIGARTRRRTAA